VANAGGGNDGGVGAASVHGSGCAPVVDGG